MAGYRPADWHPLDLDRDPTPGDPQRVRTLATQLHTFADDVSDALRLVKGMAGEDTLLQWAGKSAEVFKEQFKDVPKNLKKLKKSYELCGDALADYWPKLERAQALADKALAKAKEAQSDLSSAKSRLSSADSWVTQATKESDKYKDDPTGSKSSADKPDEAKVRAATRDVQSAKSAHTKAQSDVTTAQSALDAAKRMAEDARKMRDEAAGEAKRKIDEASDAGIPNRHWWQDVGHWFEDNWDTIVTVCKVVVAIVGIIAMIIGGPILGAIVLVAALVVLADTLYKYSKGQASLWDVAFAAMDCIPGGKGITSLGKLAKSLKEMKNLRGGMKAMSLVMRGLGKNARGMLAEGAEGAFNRLKSVVRSKGSDPVDMATGAMYLLQTDIELPGLLPLALTRRVASDYRCGWWFGPSWASTLDQRLEIDEQGIVHVTEDGLLLAYRHPAAPHTPVMPETGPRRPLTRHDDGTYRITDPLTGHTHHFARSVPDGIALLTRIEDRNDHTIDFDYDDQGTPRSIRHSGGYLLKLAVDEGRISTLTLANAGDDGTDVVVKRYRYTDGNLTETINSSGLPLRFTYDDRLRVTSWEDTNHSRYHYTYDNLGRCLSEGGEAGHISIGLAYDGVDPAWPGCRVTTVTTAAGAVSRFIIDDRCLVVAESDPLGGRVTTAYDAHQHVIETTDPLGYRTSFANNEVGQPVEVTRPDGSVVRIAYDERRRPTRLVMPDGATWLYTNDERGNVIAVTDPTGSTTRFRRAGDGSLVEALDAAGRVSTYTNNAAGLPLAITDGLGNTTRYAYNAFGLTVAVTDALGHETRLARNIEGLPVSRTDPDGSHESWEYDGEGNCVRHVDAVGQVSTFEYTHFDRLSVRTGPGGERLAFTHDADLRITQVTNPQGLVWNYTYDAAGRLLAESDFDGRTTRYTYDAAGRMATRTNALGQSIRYKRDPLGQITAKDVDGAVTHFTYTANGSLTGAVGPDSTLRVELDAAGRRVRETVDGRTIGFGYDAAGNRTLRTTPSGAQSDWAYDVAGRTVRLATQGHTVDFEHDAADRETVRHIDGALILSRAYDSLDRLVQQHGTAAGDRRVTERSYVYRADGYLTGVQDARTGDRRFDLDVQGRVTTVHATGWSERYGYDSAGNQTEAEWPASHPGHEATGPRQYTGTRLTQAGGVHYEYDAQGRVVVRRKTRLSRKPDVWRYEWSPEDRLTAVTTPDGSRWRYTYDPLGRRTAKLRLDADGETVLERTVFTWDGNALCEQTTEQRHMGVHTTLTWNHDGLTPLSQSERVWAATAPQDTIDERFFAIVTDVVGTPTELISPAGEVHWHTRTTLWGTTAWNRDASAYTPLRFPGQYHDPETGLHYNHHRHYDPETARYTSPDPLGLLPAPNPVAYVHNPHTWSDPLGLAPLCHLHGGDTGSPGGLGILPGPAPQKAADMLDKVNARSGGIGKVDGYHGNANWGNNLSALPGGKYKEWDVNAKVDLPQCSAPGCGKEIRGPERLLTPKDGPGPAYYTPDHYGTFYYVGEFTG
ncbi:RHS repeat-associated protein [Streptomyces sp. Ag109_O5-1]|uniref:RHS repeat-associated core domain-containing protein n=1 Tax=Streptomyces sp. Ag109_O5-1 TaxID=1938851 RepID=UPI000F4E3637|nr:RHS repeat-associated core domain-containing protein [Streptomyces sp. Ag109_O5-1]RPE43464.1 RHS repeat-associated protein [Streptomyces sp. Ag109_O5-1]